jgi:hypothetical protein
MKTDKEEKKSTMNAFCLLSIYIQKDDILPSIYTRETTDMYMSYLSCSADATEIKRVV